MIIPCMNCTSAGEVGGSVARVDGGNCLVGWPGAPGCTTTGPGEEDCCAWTSENKPAIPAKIATAINQLRQRETLITYARLALPLKRGDVINCIVEHCRRSHYHKRAPEAFAP